MKHREKHIAMPEAKPRSRGRGIMQRKCDCGNHTPSGSNCFECEKNKTSLQRKAANVGPLEIPSSVDAVLGSPGQRLERNTLTFMENRFRRDFSSVRVHSDDRAARSATDVGAQAYTVGQSIVFGRGRYAPQTLLGRELIAHELTHVVQQATASGPLQGSGLKVDPSPSAEREAHEFAQKIMSDERPNGSPSSGPTGLQRLPLSLQRSMGQNTCTGGTSVCASNQDCLTPDKNQDQALGQASAWAMTINNDIAASSWENALYAGEFGHTYVRLTENTGREFTYGFYPAKVLPNEAHPVVPGCIHHPDTTHASCIDDRVTYSLTQPQYDVALATAQKTCQQPPNYGPNYTCTSFAQDMAKAAGQSLPSAKSPPTTVYSQPVPPIDNPNTLHEGVEAEVAKDPKKKGLWNAETPPAFRLKPVAPIKLTDDPAQPIFSLDWMPVAGVTFRWRLFDDTARHYLLRSGGAGQEILDWLSFTNSDTALIGRKTRDLLKERGVNSGSVECTLRHPAWNDQVIRLSLSFST